MPRNAIIEKKLKVIYGNKYEFTEAYEGTRGKYPAEVFCQSGGVYEIVDLFKALNLEEQIHADHCGMRGGLIQVIIKTEDALKKFKIAIDEKSKQNISKTESNHDAFFSSNSKGINKNSFSYSSNDIGEVFNFDSNLITTIKIGLGEAIEIHTKDLAAAQIVGKNILTKLEAENHRKYGGHLRPGGMFGDESLVEISFHALFDLQKAMATNKIASTSFTV